MKVIELIYEGLMHKYHYNNVTFSFYLFMMVGKRVGRVELWQKLEELFRLKKIDLMCLNGKNDYMYCLSTHKKAHFQTMSFLKSPLT